MAVTVYSFSHRTSALNALKSVESFFERNNLDYELVQLKDSSSLPVSVPTMRAICAAEDPEATIFKNPRGMSIDDWTINDVIASGADVKIMDRFFQHRKVPLPRNIFKTRISA